MFPDDAYREAFADPDGTMPEYCTTLFGWLVAVDKDGGGTVGNAYDGTWTVSVMNGPEYLLDNHMVGPPGLRTHEQTARLAYEYAAEQEEY
jgi:hypothetical protein